MHGITPEYYELMKQDFRNPGYLAVQIGYPTAIISYGGEDILSATFDQDASPVLEDIPQTDMTLTVRNEDMFWNYEDPDSPLYTMPDRTIAKVTFGIYDDDGDPVTLHDMFLVVDSVSATETEAVIKLVDNIRTASLSIDGLMNGRSLVSASDVLSAIYRRAFTEVGQYTGIFGSIAFYNVWFNKVTPGTVGQILQAIVSAAGGSIDVCPDFSLQDYYCWASLRYDPVSITPYCNYNQGQYSAVSVQTIKAGGCNAYQDFIRVDGSFAAYDTPHTTANAGYISSLVSGTGGVFTPSTQYPTLPYLTLRLSGSPVVSGIYVEWGSVVPSEVEIQVRTSSTAEFTTLATISSGFTQRMTITEPFEELAAADTTLYEINLVIHKVPVANTVATIGYVRVLPKDGYFSGLEGEYELTRNEMMSVPDIQRQRNIRTITVPYRAVETVADNITVFSGEVYAGGDNTDVVIDLADGLLVATEYDADTKTLTMNTPPGYCQWENIVCVVDGTTIRVGNTYAPSVCSIRADYNRLYIRFIASGLHSVTVTARLLREVTGNVVYTVSDSGEDITWDTGLGLPKVHAQALARRLAEKYAKPLQYRADFRGDPAIDPGDTILFETKTSGVVPAEVTHVSTNFNGAFTGEIEVERSI